MLWVRLPPPRELEQVISASGARSEVHAVSRAVLLPFTPAHSSIISLACLERVRVQGVISLPGCHRDQEDLSTASPHLLSRAFLPQAVEVHLMRSQRLLGCCLVACACLAASADHVEKLDSKSWEEKVSFLVHKKAVLEGKHSECCMLQTTDGKVGCVAVWLLASGVHACLTSVSPQVTFVKWFAPWSAQQLSASCSCLSATCHTLTVPAGAATVRSWPPPGSSSPPTSGATSL